MMNLEMHLIQCEVINALSLQNQQHEVDIKADGLAFPQFKSVW